MGFEFLRRKTELTELEILASDVRWERREKRKKLSEAEKKERTEKQKTIEGYIEKMLNIFLCYERENQTNHLLNRIELIFDHKENIYQVRLRTCVDSRTGFSALDRYSIKNRFPESSELYKAFFDLETEKISKELGEEIVKYYRKHPLEGFTMEYEDTIQCPTVRFSFEM